MEWGVCVACGGRFVLDCLLILFGMTLLRSSMCYYFSGVLHGSFFGFLFPTISYINYRFFRYESDGNICR